MKWYTTIDLPGGNHAVMADNEMDAVTRTGVDADLYSLRRARGDGPMFIPAAPDLSEWLEQVVTGGLWSMKDGRQAVPGGWLVYVTHSHIEANEQWGEHVTAVYVPVAGSANMTIKGRAE